MHVKYWSVYFKVQKHWRPMVDLASSIPELRMERSWRKGLGTVCVPIDVTAG